MSAWNTVREQLAMRSLIEFELTEAEHRVVRSIAEGYILEHVRVNLQVDRSPWDTLVESSIMGGDYWRRTGTDDDLPLNSKEAEALEDASGQMGVEPPATGRARKTMLDPKVAVEVYRNLSAHPEKYTASLGGPQAYAALMKKVVRVLRDKLKLGAKQLNPPTAPPVKDPNYSSSRVRDQDVASMKGSGKASTTVKDPKDQQKVSGMEDPSDWDLDEAGNFGRFARGALAAGLMGLGGNALAQDQQPPPTTQQTRGTAKAKTKAPDTRVIDYKKGFKPEVPDRADPVMLGQLGPDKHDFSKEEPPQLRGVWDLENDR